jgi:hypothetical protein
MITYWSHAPHTKRWRGRTCPARLHRLFTITIGTGLMARARALAASATTDPPSHLVDWMSQHVMFLSLALLVTLAVWAIVPYVLAP